MLEVKVWILIGALAVTTTVIGFLGKMIANSIIKKMDELVTKLDKLIQETTSMRKEVDHLKEQYREHGTRMNNHANRLRELELKVKNNRP